MNEGSLYVIHGHALRIYPKAYLVEVLPREEKVEYESRFSDIPEWVFGSRRAIWLTLENGTMVNRAKRGDQIKNELLSFLSV